VKSLTSLSNDQINALRTIADATEAAPYNPNRAMTPLDAGKVRVHLAELVTAGMAKRRGFTMSMGPGGWWPTEAGLAALDDVDDDQ